MENWQKVLLVFILFVIVVALDLLLFFKTDKLINDTEYDLGILKDSIEKEDLEEINSEECKEKSKDLNTKWAGYESILSFFIEHDEMERVSAKIAIIEQNVKNKEYNTALEDIVETRYLLDYIKDKYNLNFKNIF